MENKQKTLLTTGLLLPVIAGIIVEIFTSVEIVKPVLGFLKHLFCLLIIPLDIPVWLLLVIVLSTISITWISYFLINRDKKPEYESYTSDRIYEVDWIWDWLDGEIINLVALCPECSYQPFIERGFEQYLAQSSEVNCDNCGFHQVWQYSPDTLRSRVVREIHRKIRTDEYKAAT